MLLKFHLIVARMDYHGKLQGIVLFCFLFFKKTFSQAQLKMR